MLSQIKLQVEYDPLVPPGEIDKHNMPPPGLSHVRKNHIVELRQRVPEVLLYD